jgi:prolyl-tRNA editing enzyme YbaK/EbsC (Cys-tRNA(Pro) deacylase)
MPNLPPAALALSNFGVPYRLFEHQGPVNSLEQAAAERNQDPHQVIRSILFRIGEGNFFMVLAAGPNQISWPSLRSYLKQSRLTLATEAEVLLITGYKVGAVSPFGVPSPLRIIADENVFLPEEVSIGSGKRGTAIILKSTDLRSTLGNIEIGKFCE